MRSLRALLLGSAMACGSFGTTASPTDGGTTPPATDGAPSDGGTNSGDAESPPGCATRAPFKDGFERENDNIKLAWSEMETKDGTLAIDKFNPLRGSSSLKVDLLASQDGWARLTRDLAPDDCPISVAFVFRATSLPTEGHATVAMAIYDAGELELRLLEGGAFEIADDKNGASAVHSPIPFSVTLNTPFHVQLTFDAKAKKVSYRITPEQGNATKGVAQIVTDHPAPPTSIVVGADNVKTSLPFAYFLDDIDIE